MKLVRETLSIVAALIVSLPALAQDAIQPYVEYRKRVESAQNISPLDVGLFGEQVSLFNGSTSFTITDIDVPGNQDLPVRLTRKFAVELQPQNELGTYDSLLRGLGNWDVDVPYMAGTYAASQPNALRCNGPYVPDDGTYFRRGDVWQGISVNVPGRGSALALGIQSVPVPKPTDGSLYKLSTTERDMLDCIPMQSGSGEGFRMTTASGLRYYFDVAASRTAARLVRSYKDSNGFLQPIYLDRNRQYLLASKIEDRFGNTVQFQYNSNGHPTRIWSSDGREINLTYSGGRLVSASSHGRTWQYAYSHSGPGIYGRLSQVTQPDGSKWQYSYSDDLIVWPGPAGLPQLPGCTVMPPPIEMALTVTATHPSGAIGTFNFGNRRHFRSGVHATECQQTGDPANPDYELLVPYFFDVMSINSKTLTGPGLSAMTWTYAYGGQGQMLWGSPTVPLPYPCTTCPESKTVTVNNPDGSMSRYTFGVRYHDNEGRQLKVETLDTDHTVVRTETNTYMTEAQAASQPFHGIFGTVLGNYVSDPASVRVRPVTSRTISQDGVNFVWQANTFDTLARPKSVTRSSTLTGNPTRTEETTYHDNLAKWVLGQVSQVACTAPAGPLPGGCGPAGAQMFERTFDATHALPLVTKRFTRLEQTLVWDTTSSVSSGQRGTLRSVADGNGNVTTLSNWKRGIPQSIKFPPTPEETSGATQTAQVNDKGWLDWIIDENGSRTCYAYDAMGRLTQVTYPSESTAGLCNSTSWDITTQSFQIVNGSEYGIAAGHWRQTVSTGNARRIVYFDALWRPLVEEAFDNADAAGTRSVTVKRYDLGGRLAFQSYPMASLGNYSNASLKGTFTSYDALGRVKQVRADWEAAGQLTTATEYLSGFRVRVTNPRGYPTTTSYLAWDQPNTDFPILVEHPEGARTQITRDAYGNPVRIRRGNASGTITLDRTYSYGGRLMLCAVTEPETGTLVHWFDNVGNLIQTAGGLSIPDGTSCNAAKSMALASGRVVTRTYDARNRLTAMTFPDGRGNQAWSYTPDGLPQTISAHNGGSDLITTTYTYNRRRLLTNERLTWTAGSINWPVTYAYNRNGHLASESWHGISATYAPDALGRPTQVGGYATGVKYHPNGAIKEFTYGNGIRHVMTQNARGLPDTSCDFHGSCGPGAVLNDQYDYDQNGNVWSISDGRSGGRGNRDMTYDGLDRLTGTASPTFGTATYAYDVLDNLTRVSVTAGNAVRNHWYCYNGNWHLGFVRSGPNCTGNASPAVQTLHYDEQGNLSQKNAAVFQFDMGNRLRVSGGTGHPSTTYLYDAHGRRVLDRVGSTPRVGQYARDGRLIQSSNSRNGVFSEYFYLQGSLVAIRERDTTVTPNVYSVKYQHTDALGSPVAITNESRTVVERTEYEPYGWTANRASRDGTGYTGHVEDAASGLVYMQQRYYDPGIGRFLSVDSVTAYSNPAGAFNRYWYANNNPYSFTDPDGRLSRGTGWSDKEWKQFDRAQQSAAGSLEKAASKITNAMAEGGKALQRAEKSFERNFGAGTATPGNMTQAASDMSAMAAALRDTSANAIPANAMTGQALAAAYPGIGADTLAGVPTSGPPQVIVNTSHPGFNSPSTLAWGAGHETGHAVLGYKDQKMNGIPAYKFGTPQQQQIFKTLPGPQRLINPDHLMDYAR